MSADLPACPSLQPPSPHRSSVNIPLTHEPSPPSDPAFLRGVVPGCSATSGCLALLLVPSLLLLQSLLLQFLQLLRLFSLAQLLPAEAVMYSYVKTKEVPSC
jgi:hypothetical protein